MTDPMMKCGCRANGIDNRTKKPCCVIHGGLKEGWNEVAPEPDLEYRQAQCCYCKKLVPSKEAIAFFEYHPDKQYDDHYDGCRGWD